MDLRTIKYLTDCVVNALGILSFQEFKKRTYRSNGSILKHGFYSKSEIEQNQYNGQCGNPEVSRKEPCNNQKSYLLGAQDKKDGYLRTFNIRSIQIELYCMLAT